MLQRGGSEGDKTRKLRFSAWLLVGAMLYAGGLGHLLHPWLHEHPSRHQPQQADHLAGPRLYAPAHEHAHHPCALCAFLAHFVARKAASPATGLIKPVFLGRAAPIAEARLITVDHRLPDSRSPPAL